MNAIFHLFRTMDDRVKNNRRLGRRLCRAAGLLWLLFFLWSGSYCYFRIKTEKWYRTVPVEPLSGIDLELVYGIGLSNGVKPPTGACYVGFFSGRYSPSLTRFYLPLFQFEHFFIVVQKASFREAVHFFGITNYFLVALLAISLGVLLKYGPLMIPKHSGKIEKKDAP